MSLRQYLVMVSIAIVLLMGSAAAVLIQQVESFGRAQSERQLLQTTQALSQMVDAEMGAYESVLKALRASGGVQRRDWAAFDRQARQLMSGPDAWIVVGDRSGRQIVNTRLPQGTQLPRGPMPPAVWAQLDRGETHICDLTAGLIERQILCVDVPIMAQGRAEYLLSIIFRPQAVGALVNRQRLQQRAFATILDSRSRVVWRNVDPERFIGAPGTQDMRNALRTASDGVIESHSLEGVPTVAAFSRSSRTGWTFIVGIPRSAMRGGSPTILAGGTIAVFTFLMIGALIGLIAARRIDGAVGKLASIPSLPSGGGPISFKGSGIKDIDVVGQALVEARVALQKSEERYRRVFEQTSDLLVTADLNQIITDCNPAAAEAVGVSREEAIGRPISDFISPTDFERTSSKLMQKMQRGGTTRYDVRVRSRSGEWLDWEINSGLITDSAGQPVGLHVVGRDITERRRAEELQRLLVNELNHRVKNTLAIVQSLAHQSFKNVESPDEARQAFEARLNALAAAHNLLTRETWERATLEQTLREAVTATAGPRAGQVSLEGPEVTLAPQTAVSVAMAAHELATNAIKYGALSRDEGRIDIKWSIDPAKSGPRLRLDWREQGGPKVDEPARRGFGSRLIERGLAAELGGTVKLEFLEDGLHCVVDAPLPSEGEANIE